MIGELFLNELLVSYSPIPNLVSKHILSWLITKSLKKALVGVFLALSWCMQAQT